MFKIFVTFKRKYVVELVNLFNQYPKEDYSDRFFQGGL